MNDATGNDTFDALDQVVRPPHRLFVCAWTAYVRPTIYFLIFIAVGYLMATMFWVAGTVWMVLALALFAYNVLTIRSVRLYTDDEGVWMFAGIFPWNKGVSGVKWRDLDEATYMQSFFSWAFKAFTVRVAHRFTKASEMVLTHIREGDEAVIHINRMHLQRINQSAAPVEDTPSIEAA